MLIVEGETAMHNEQIQEWMNANDEFLIVIDETGTIVHVNRAWVDFCIEHSVRESLRTTGTDYFMQLIERKRLNEVSAIQDVIKGGKTEHKQIYPFLLQNGKKQWLSVKVRKIKLVSSDSYGALISHKPISLHDIEPITAEHVLESMTDGFALMNDKFQLNYINEIAEQLFSVKREDVIGLGLFDFFPEAEGSSFHQAYERAMNEQVVIEFEDYYHPLGTWYQIKVCPLKKGGIALYFKDVSEQKKIEKQLSVSVYYDHLTDLPNRLFLMEKTRSLMEKKKNFTIFYLNIDNLKLINTIYSHETGDMALKQVAERLRSIISDRCEIFRLNGDEFTIVYEGGNPEVFAEKITDLFEQPFAIEHGQPLFISASVGISCYPDDASLFSDLVAHAETAMYEAKKTRGPSYKFFRPAMHIRRSRRSAIEECLSGDLNGIGIYYALQPQINGNSSEMAGIEMLARWNHSELGAISPLEFIEVAEATGVIAPLTLHLIEHVFIQMNDWQQRFGWSPRTAINMTPSLLANPAFFDDFFGLIEQYEIRPQLVEVEITEQAELTYSDRTLQHLLLCKSKGISIAIDDFGTGFSMISYLTHFPINKIKIDRSFIQKIGNDRKSEAVLKSLIHLAKSIECDLVAEGVERPKEVEFLLANGCAVFQGYLYDKPMNPADFEAKYLQLAANVSASTKTLPNPPNN